MCVIIIKQPGIIIPKDKIITACHVNNDGFGLSVLKDKELLTFKNYDPKGNDPDELYRIMAEFQALPQFIHLRFTTRGEKSLNNCHPFPLLKNDEMDVQFMHNGTMYDLKDEKTNRSDSRIYAEDIASDLSKAFYALDGKDFIKNETYCNVMTKYAGSSGVFVVYDNHGNYVTIGDGVKYDGWWASNSYSFNKTHREPTYASGYTEYTAKKTGWDSKTNTYTRADGSVVYWNYKTNKYESFTDSESDTGRKAPALPPASASQPKAEPEAQGSKPVPFQDLFNDDTKEQCQSLGYALTEAKRKSLSWAEHTPPSERYSFVELAGLTNLEDVCLLTVEEIEEMVLQIPQAASVLILDLLHELYTTKRPAQRQAA